jgi:hypothetical protein
MESEPGGRNEMDWIEQWFGFAPDNGDGSVELLIMLTVAVVVAVAVVWIVPSFRARAVHFFAQLYARTAGRRKG